MGKNTMVGRASFKYLPKKNSAIDLIFNYENDKMPGVDFKSGTFAPMGGDISPFTFADMEAGKDLQDRRDVYGITFQYKQLFTDALSMTAITGYRSVNAISVFDSDGTKAKAMAFDARVDYRQLSQELRFNYNVNCFSGFAGANYFHEDGNIAFNLSMDERSFFAMLSPKFAAYGIQLIINILNFSSYFVQPFIQDSGSLHFPDYMLFVFIPLILRDKNSSREIDSIFF